MNAQTVEFIVNLSILLGLVGLVMRAIGAVDTRIDDLEHKVGCLECVRWREKARGGEKSFKLDKGKD